MLWRFHSIHHSSEELDWLVNTRAHPLDMVFTRLCALIPLYVLGLAQPTGNTVDVVPFLYALVGSIWSFVIHANVRWRFGWLECWYPRPVSTIGTTPKTARRLSTKTTRRFFRGWTRFSAPFTCQRKRGQ